jgi:YD repeat-containing protein
MIGRLTSITGTYGNGNTDATYVSGITYGSQSGGVSQITYGLGTDTFTYEDSGRLQSIGIFLPYQAGTYGHQTNLTYTYSLSNRITQINETNTNLPDINHTFEYDRWGRLIAETGQFNHTWSYDRYNNHSGVANPANNRLLAFIDHYDAVGNQRWDASNSYDYDARNLMKQATRRSGSVLLGQYRYDSLGRKVKKTSSGGNTAYIYGANGEILGVRPRIVTV